MRLLCDTSPAWLPQALARFDEVLVDHAHCEKKAAAHALSLLAAHLRDAELRQFYARLAGAEKGHGELFLRLARKAAPSGFESRFAELARAEAKLVRELPVRPAIH